MMPSPKKKSGDKKQIGRPLEYTKEMGDYICELTATHGCGLDRLTKMYPEIPAKETIRRWRYRVEEFRVQYAQAKLDQADILAEECLEIADDASRDMTYDKDGNEICNTEFIARSRLRVDTRKWLAAKLLPRQYGTQAEEGKTTTQTLVETIIDKLSE